MRNSLHQNPMPAMTIAIAGGAIVATGMMFVPVAVLEGLTGPTGLSGLVPAVGAPLGDGARVLIAYAAGTMTLGGLTAMLLWNDRRHAEEQREIDPKGVAQFLSGITDYMSAKISWVKKADKIRTLADLAKFRNDDVPSNPAVRRPLLASRDLPALSLVKPTLAGDHIHAAIMRHIAHSVPLPVNENAPDLTAETSTKAMVDQLETAVAQRYQRLNELALTTFGDAAEAEEERVEAIAAATTREVPCNEPARSRHPVLELVSSQPAKDDDADTALAAALATLHRMAANAR